jgi:hypothetical protein
VTFVDMMITRRHFAARYVHLGRALLGDLAVAYGIDFDLAEQWADDIDRETAFQIAAVRHPLVQGGGIAGVAIPIAATPAHPEP